MILKKILPFEVKEISHRVLEFIGSTEDKDRLGDEVIGSGWQLKNYKKNPVFLWAHNYDMPPVGKANKVWLDEGRLKFHIQFPEAEEYEFADTIYKLYKGGYIRGTSVGFMPLESEPIETKEDERVVIGHIATRYLRQDLLELSGCAVPANPNALAEAKAAGLITVKQLKEIETIEKPYANEHACRLRDPGDFKPDSFRRTERMHEGKKYSVIMGRLKGEDTMTEQSYRYPKDTWETDEARGHCKSHDGTFEPAQKESRTAISYQSAHPKGTPKAPEDEDWEAGKEVAAAEVEDLKVMCAILQGDAELKTSYKLPHHKAKGHAVVWKGVAAAGAVLMGARGGIDATEAEKQGAKAHLVKHYAEFDKEPPWEKSVSQAQLADDLDYLAKAIDEVGLNPGNEKTAWEMVRRIMGKSGDHMPVDIAIKIGMTLIRRNRDRLAEIKRLAQEVLDSAQKEEPEKMTEADVVRLIEATIREGISKAQTKRR